MARITKQFLAGLVVLTLPAFLHAQEADKKADEPTAQKTEVTTVETKAEPSDWLHQKKMTGDWGGVRTELANKGITFDLDITQVLQGNAHGGASTKNGLRYSGSADLTLVLDTGKMGLWPGGQFVFHGEPKWGDGINKKVGSLMPVNIDAYKPSYGDGCEMALSEFFYQQVLFEGKLILLGGKLDGSRAFDNNVFANDETSQFMNLAFRNAPQIGSFLPYTTLGVGAIVNPTDWLSIRTAVTDTDGSATRTGFDTAFHGDTNTSVIHEWDFTIKPFDKEGHQRIGFVWTCENTQHLNPTTPFRQTTPMLVKMVGLKMLGKMAPYLPYDKSDDNVMLYYNFDQFLITKADDPKQGIGLFGRFSWARNDVNALSDFYSIGIGGKGMIPERSKDQYGVGYYYANLSDRLPPGYMREQGVEMYYNFEITPWLHISPDFQIVMDPGGTSNVGTSLVYGLRIQMNL